MNRETVDKSVAIETLRSVSHIDLCARVVELTAEVQRLERLLDKANDTAIELRQEMAAASSVIGTAVGSVGDLLDRCNRARNKINGSEVPF